MRGEPVSRRLAVALVVSVACLALFLSSTLARADEAQSVGSESSVLSVASLIGKKFVRGAANCVLAVIEFPKQIYLVGRQEGALLGATRGLSDGFGMFLARSVAGAYEVLTFPIPIPPQYQPMLLPEFVWEPETVASNVTGSPSAKTE